VVAGEEWLDMNVVGLLMEREDYAAKTCCGSVDLLGVAPIVIYGLEEGDWSSLARVRLILMLSVCRLT